MEHADHVQRSHRDLLRDAALTLAAVILAFLALDDITTDNATSFAFERLALACCAAWLLIEAWRLMRGGHRVLGAISMVVVASSAVTQAAIGPGTLPSLRVAYVIAIVGLLWFAGLAGVLVHMAWRSARKHAA